MEEHKIEISNETRLEIILRVLLLERIIDAQQKGKKEEEINIIEISDKAEKINEMLFDDKLINKISELI